MMPPSSVPPTPPSSPHSGALSGPPASLQEAVALLGARSGPSVAATDPGASARGDQNAPDTQFDALDVPRFDPSDRNRIAGFVGDVVVEVEQLARDGFRTTGTGQMLAELPSLPGHFEILSTASLPDRSTEASPTEAAQDTLDDSGGTVDSESMGLPMPPNPNPNTAAAARANEAERDSEVDAESAGQSARANSGSAPVAPGRPLVPPPIQALEVLPPVHLEQEVRPNSRALKILSASVAQAIGSGLTFGLKSYVEEGVNAGLETSDLGQLTVGNIPASRVLANLAGGAFVGLVHSSVSKSLGAYAASSLGADTYTDTNQSLLRREANDALTGSAPIVGAFTAAFTGGAAVKAAVGGNSVNAFVGATMRAVQSVGGGFISGGVTAAAREAMSDSYERTTPDMGFSDIKTRFGEALNAQFGGSTNAAMLKESVGKILGGTFGMLAATFAADAAANSMHGVLPTHEEVDLDSLSQSVGGAAGMLAFLACWFGAQHAMNLTGSYLDAQTDAQAGATTEGAVREMSEDSSVYDNPLFDANVNPA